MKIVITGGVGFIGANLVCTLARGGAYDIVLVDDLSVGRVAWLEGAMASAGDVVKEGTDEAPSWRLTTPAGTTTVSLVVTDVRERADALEVTAGAQSVVHLAAQTGVPQSLEEPVGDFNINAIGTHAYLDACRQNGVRLFLMASSAAVLGGGGGSQDEVGAMRPLSPYGAGKAAGEVYCSAYRVSYGIDTLALRFSNVYGPHAWAKGSVVAAFCKRALRGQPLMIDGDGGQTRDFLHVEDLCDVVAAIAIGQARPPEGMDFFGGALNVGSGTSTAIGELAGRMQEMFKVRGIECQLDHAPARAGDVRVSAPNVGKLETVLPDLKRRSLWDGLPETIAWFCENWKPKN